MAADGFCDYCGFPVDDHPIEKARPAGRDVDPGEILCDDPIDD